MGFVSDDGNADMRFAGVRLEGGGDGIKARYNGSKLRQKTFRCLKAGLIEFLEDVDIIASVNVIAEHFAIVDDFHESIALFALMYAFGETGENFSIGAIQGVIFEQRFAQCAGLSV